MIEQETELVEKELNLIKCELCGMICKMQIPATHLKKAHGITTKEYKAMGLQTLSPARLAQLRASPVGSGTEKGERGKFGENHWNWKGGHTNGVGYRVVYKQGRKDLEHRFVAEEMLGRPLNSDEVVHHKDGNRSNNSPDNLVVMKRNEHDRLKDGTKRHFHISEETEEAARILHNLGWSINKIGKAIRVEHRTVSAWLEKLD